MCRHPSCHPKRTARADRCSEAGCSERRSNGSMTAGKLPNPASQSIRQRDQTATNQDQASGLRHLARIADQIVRVTSPAAGLVRSWSIYRELLSLFEVRLWNG